MVAFAPIVQVDLSGTAFGAAPTWTDITRFVRLKSPISITKWRQDQLSDVAPSTMRLVLDNAELLGDATAPNAGRFTPFLTSSPWSPRILPGVRIRAGVIVNAVTYWRFDGYVDEWDAAYEDGEFGICTVSASDILARLGAADPLRTVYVEEVLTDSPAAFYPLTEPAGSTKPASVTAAAAPVLTIGQYGPAGDATFGGATGIPTDGSSTLSLNTTLSAASSDDLNGDYLTSVTPVCGPATSSTLEAVVSLNANLATALNRTGTRAYLLMLLNPVNGNFISIQLGFNAGAVQMYDGGFIGPNLNDGAVHHIALVNDTVANQRIYYVDGVVVSTIAGAFALLGSGSLTHYLYVGGVDWTTTVGGHLQAGQVPMLRGGVGYVAAYSSAPSAARIAAHNTAARTAFAGEGTTTHISRLLTYRTNLGSTLDTGQGTVGAHAIAGATEQQALLETAKAEGGVLYADPATGRIVLLARSRLRNPASVLTLDITAWQTTADLNVRANRDLLLNDVTITRTGGSAQRKTDQTSKSTYGTKGLTDTRLVGTDQEAANTAGWLVANGKDVRASTPALTVDLLTEPSLTVAAGVLNLVPLQRITLINPPSSMPATDVLVQGCTDTIGVDQFTCALFVSPMPRPTLRFDAAADAFTKLDSGNVFAW